MSDERYRVLTVDDSALMRAVLREMIDEDSRLELAGEAASAMEAAGLIDGLDPDVVVLDVHMPEIDGLTFLDRLMDERPIPVVMFSSATERGALAAVNALEIGAVDFVSKPREALESEGFERACVELCDKLVAAAGMRADLPEASGGGEDGQRSVVEILSVCKTPAQPCPEKPSGVAPTQRSPDEGAPKPGLPC